MKTGVVKKLLELKNFGFINSEGKDYFFHREDFLGHWDDLVSDYRSGIEIKVQFLREDSAKGLRARNVSRLDFPNQGELEFAQ
jgi:cold shock CspA family protein